MLTLEERERFAYITNSPEHPLVVLAPEQDEDLRGERDDYKKQAEESDDQVSELKGKVEDLEDQVETLKEQIHDAGVDLV